MNTQFHTPSFGDEVFDSGDSSTSTPTAAILGGNLVNNMYSYQQQTPTSTQTKYMINLHNSSSDEYHTANEDSFNVTANNSMSNSIIQPNTNTTPNSAAGNTTGPTTMAARKQMLPIDQNEPAKPLSAYALFFRDTVSAIKQQNPTCSFQELSKIVASMWDALDPAHKNVYNKKNELAKTEYIKQMRIYQQQQQQQKQEQLNANASDSVTMQQQQQQGISNTANIISNQQQQSIQHINNNNTNQVTSTNTTITSTPNTSATAGTPSANQNNLPAEAGTLQKCTRENCNKRAIINPDWEDEYCSNECVIIHCRNVFNAWVQSNLEAKQQQQQQQQTPAT